MREKKHDIHNSEKLQKMHCASPEKIGNLEVIEINSSAVSSPPSRISTSSKNIESPSSKKQILQKETKVNRTGDKNMNCKLFDSDGEPSVHVKQRNTSFDRIPFPVCNVREKRSTLKMNCDHNVLKRRRKSMLQKGNNMIHEVHEKKLPLSLVSVSPKRKHILMNEFKSCFNEDLNTDPTDFENELSLSNVQTNEMMAEINLEKPSSPSRKTRHKNKHVIHECKPSSSSSTAALKRQKKQIPSNDSSGKHVIDLTVSENELSPSNERESKEINPKIFLIKERRKIKQTDISNTYCNVHPTMAPSLSCKRKKKHKHLDQNESVISHNENSNIEIFPSRGKLSPSDMEILQEINPELSLKRMQKQTDDDNKICNNDSPNIISSPSCEKKHKFLKLNDSSIHQNEDFNINVTAFGDKFPQPDLKLSKENNPEISLLKSKEKRKMKKQTGNTNSQNECSNLLLSPKHRRKKKYKHVDENESNVSQNLNSDTDLFFSGDELHPPDMKISKEINPEFGLLTSKENKKMKKRTGNANSQNECSNLLLSPSHKRKKKHKHMDENESIISQNVNPDTNLLSSGNELYPNLLRSPSPKRKKKHKHVDENESNISQNKDFNTDLLILENECPSTSVRINGSEEKIDLERSVVKSKTKRNIGEQINNTKIYSESENDPFSMLPSPSRTDSISCGDDNGSFSFLAEYLMETYSRELGNEKMKWDKFWNDAVLAKSGKKYSKEEIESIQVHINHDIPHLHSVDISPCSVPTKEERERLAVLGMKQTAFSKFEDSIIMQNWKNFRES